VTGKDDAALAVEVTSEAGYARQDLEGRHVEVGQDSTPAGHETIDFVLHHILPVCDPPATSCATASPDWRFADVADCPTASVLVRPAAPLRQ
jgi:hypothetical protein